jgi:hypothetical protein
VSHSLRHCRQCLIVKLLSLQLILGRVADVATAFDDNGINIRFMNSTVEGNCVRDSTSAAAVAQQVGQPKVPSPASVLQSLLLSRLPSSHSCSVATILHSSLGPYQQSQTAQCSAAWVPAIGIAQRPTARGRHIMTRNRWRIDTVVGAVQKAKGRSAASWTPRW